MAFDPVSAVANFGSSLVSLGSEFIEDKDKRNEFNFKTKELESNLSIALLSNTTTPRVDALVKLILVTKQFIRPLCGAMMTAFGAYCHYKGISMDAAMQAIFDGALPAWGVSRHVNESKKLNQPKRIEYIAGYDEDDITDNVGHD